MALRKTIFTSDLDFCPDCGTVLPLPGMEDIIVCRKCDYRVDVAGALIIYLISVYATNTNSLYSTTSVLLHMLILPPLTVVFIIFFIN